jgi:hypothetical protein
MMTPAIPLDSVILVTGVDDFIGSQVSGSARADWLQGPWNRQKGV